MAGMMKKAQEMQTKMAEMQDELANISVTGESGACPMSTASPTGIIGNRLRPQVSSLSSSMVSPRTASNGFGMLHPLVVVEQEASFRERRT